MESLDDRQLLCQYASNGSEPAFAELVSRYLDTIYASALRQVRDPAAAADVTQAVFIALAQQAARLAPNTLLVNWLMTVTRCAARESLRRQARRDRHEHKAAAMKPVTSLPPEPAPDFAALIPHLDAALARLPSADRSAILLRYFQQKSLREVSLALHTSEEAARKRITRALAKLRQLFARQGITLSVAAVAAALASGAAAQAAPPALAATVTATALAAAKGTLATGTALTLAKGALHMLTLVKLKLAALIAAATVAVAATGAVMVHQAPAQAPAPDPVRPAATPAATVPASGALTAAPKLANATKVFPTSPPDYQDSVPWYYLTMRLSPDGRYLLYSRPVSGRDPADQRPARYQLIVRELAGGRETALPVIDRARIPLHFNHFDPASQRLILPDTASYSLPLLPIQWAIHDLHQGKATGLRFAGSRIWLPKFTADGRALLMTTVSPEDPKSAATRRLSLQNPKAEPQTLTAPGGLVSLSPTGEAAVFYVPRGTLYTPRGKALTLERPQRLVLWDLQADEEVTPLPLHPNISDMDQFEPLWTADGRYLYYLDGEEQTSKAPTARPGFRYVTRVWDWEAGKFVATIPDVLPVGPGPGRSSIVLGRYAMKDRFIIVHDAATGKQYPLGDASMKLIHAAGGKILYAAKPGHAADEAIFVADLVVPNAAK